MNRLMIAAAFAVAAGGAQAHNNVELCGIESKYEVSLDGTIPAGRPPHACRSSP